MSPLEHLLSNQMTISFGSGKRFVLITSALYSLCGTSLLHIRKLRKMLRGKMLKKAFIDEIVHLLDRIQFGVDSCYHVHIVILVARLVLA
ncbi:hypothetical protein TorRG33x02_024020 [Trema orientale]|uniref:Uncharacterized protein n=1 Tax=Trema orientale TaxID=63057 RepID=A0A2P5FV29_TREOI|nr:hypothetical protein TorRG33x02_024020 [Trema orientale]